MSIIASELFQFVSAVQIRQNLSSDLDELHICIDAEAWKASIVLIGSLIESVLYHHINTSPKIRNKIKKFDKRNDVTLSNLLLWSKQNDIIDENLFRLADPIRDYRNLIHPRVNERLKTKLNENLIRIGYHVLLEIISVINEKNSDFVTEEHELLIQDIVKKELGRVATQADFSVFIPILQKYGINMGSRIVERSLQQGKNNE